MTDYTRSELVTRTYQYAALVGAEETISAADYDLADVTITDMFDLLAARNINVWNGSDDSIPSAYMLPLATYAAMWLKHAFGGPFPTNDEIVGNERVLRQLSAKPATGAVATAEYF